MTRRMYAIDSAYLAQAICYDPSGLYCAKCKNENNFCDDCGWFYVYVNSIYSPICEDCWNSGGYTTCER